MPELSVWTVRSALVALVVGTLMGALMLAAKAGMAPPTLMRLLPVHQEIVLLGWLVQLAMGVGYWILPRVDGARPRAWLAVVAVICLDAGVVAAALGAWFGVTGAIVCGRILELVAAIGFVGHFWTRIRLGGLINRLSAEEIAARRP